MQADPRGVDDILDGLVPDPGRLTGAVDAAETLLQAAIERADTPAAVQARQVHDPRPGCVPKLLPSRQLSHSLAGRGPGTP